MSSFAGRVLGLMLVWSLAVPVFAVAFSGSVQADGHSVGIQNVITRQLEAFRTKNADAAWAIAAPSIQRMFGTKERFMDMVDNHYPQIMNSKSAIFKGLREVNGSIVQRVFVEGGPGDFVDAYYTVEKIDGAWRITSVYVTKPKDEGA